MRRILFILCFVVASGYVFGQQLEVSLTGNLDFSHGFSTLNEAGTDFQSPIVSNSLLYLSVEYNDWLDYVYTPDKPWGINVHKENMNWNSGLKLELMRGGNGTNALSWYSNNRPPVNGNEFKEISDNVPAYFFEGEHGRLNIPVIVRLVDASVTMGAGDYGSTIYFTVYER